MHRCGECNLLEVNTNNNKKYVLYTYVLCQCYIPIYFILSSEFNAYLKQIKVILSVVKNYRIFFSLVTNTIYIFFTVANRGCFVNLGLTFFPKRSGMHRS